MANNRFGLCRSCVTIILPASPACNDSAEDWADTTAPSCFKVRKSSKWQDQGDVVVVPRSGTGELSGLRGEGGFEGQFGKGIHRNAELLVRMKFPGFCLDSWRPVLKPAALSAVHGGRSHPAPPYPHLKIDNISLNSNNIPDSIGKYV